MGIRATMEYVGYSPREIRLYIAALEAGDSTASELAAKADMPLTTTEEVLRRMHKRGLVNPYSKGRRMYWAAERPARILATLEDKRTAFEAIVPKLEGKKRIAEDNRLSVVTFTGLNEIKLIMADIIQTKQPISAIMDWDHWLGFLGEDFINDFIDKRFRHNLRLKLITNLTTLSENLKRKDSKELRITRFLGSSIKVDGVYFLYGNKIALIVIDKKRPSAVLIEDVSISGVARLLFETLWRTLG